MMKYRHTVDRQDTRSPMPAKPETLNLLGEDQHHHVVLQNIRYLGHGVYHCNISIRSNGFTCEKDFAFDNDEYFLAKLREVCTNQTGDAELTDLQSDNYLKIQAFDADTLLITGLILEEQPYTQALEFAFITQYPMVERFLSEFTRVIRATH